MARIGRPGSDRRPAVQAMTPQPRIVRCSGRSGTMSDSAVIRLSRSLSLVRPLDSALSRVSRLYRPTAQSTTTVWRRTHSAPATRVAATRSRRPCLRPVTVPVRVPVPVLAPAPATRVRARVPCPPAARVRGSRVAVRATGTGVGFGRRATGAGRGDAGRGRGVVPRTGTGLVPGLESCAPAGATPGTARRGSAAPSMGNLCGPPPTLAAQCRGRYPARPLSPFQVNAWPGSSRSEGGSTTATRSARTTRSSPSRTTRSTRRCRRRTTRGRRTTSSASPRGSTSPVTDLPATGTPEPERP